MTEGNREVEDLPKGWATCELQSLCELITKGSTPTTHGHQYKAQGINFVKTENINNNGFIFNIKQFIDEEANDFLKRSQLNVGDILFSIAGTIGRIGIVREKDFPANTNQALSIIRLIKNTISDKYLFYFLKSPLVQKNILKSIAGVGRANLSLKDIGELNILLSPLPEQNRIVEKIEELFSDVDQGIESLKTAQKQLKVYRQAVLKWAFEGKLTEAWRKQHSSTLKTGEALLAEIKAERENRYQQQLAEWEEKVREWEAIGKVGKKPQRPQKYKDPSPISNAQTSGSPSIPESWLWTNLEQLKEFSLYGPRFSSQDYVDDGIPIARTTDISSSGKVDLKYAPKISLSDKEFEKYKLIKGDLLLTRTGSIGTNAVFHLTEKAIPGAFLIHYRLLPSLNIWFIFYFLESPKAQQHFFKKSSGVGRPNLNVPSIEELIIPLPSLEEQEQVVEEIESRLSICDQLEATIIENLQKAEALRQSILKQAFEGKLVPQDSTDEPAEKLLERIKVEKTQNKTSSRRSSNDRGV